MLRFLIIVVFLAGLGMAGMWALATFVTPQQRETRITVPPELYAPKAPQP